jgi:integrase
MSTDVSQELENIAFPGSRIKHQRTQADITNQPLSSPVKKTMKLTKSTIRALALPEGVSDHTFFDDDVPGFGLRLRASGAKRWVVQYNIGRRCRRVVLGSPETLDVVPARGSAKDILAAVRLGRDPAGERQEARSEHAQSFGRVVPRYLDYKRASLRASTMSEVERSLTVHAKPLHGRAIKMIDRRTIAALIDGLVTTSGPAAADRTRATLHAFFHWCIRDGLIEFNPAVAVNRPVTNGARTRVLSNAEIELVWTTLTDDAYGDIVRMLMLTAARREEIGGLSWSEVDLDRALISITAERMKGKRPHDIPLSPQALVILKRRHVDAGDHPFVFAGMNYRGEPRSFGDWSNARLAHHKRITAINGKPLPDWRLHDFRRTFSTIAHDKLDIPTHVVEACLAHFSGHRAGVAGVYNRATYAGQRKAALEAWADYVARIVDANVISLPSAA